MMGPGVIREQNRKAAEQAAKRKKTPVLIEQEDIDDESLPQVPHIGDHIPEGWERVDIKGWEDPHAGIRPRDESHSNPGILFVDSSGIGSPVERALTQAQFRKTVKPGYGYAVVSAGQFQVKVGVFKRVYD